MHLINTIITFTVIIPIIYSLLNIEILKATKSVFVILIISLLVESINIISKYVFDTILVNFANVYSIIEIGFITYFYLKFSDGKYKILILVTSILLSLYLLITYIVKEFHLNVNINYALTSIYEIIVASIFMLRNTENILKNWKFTVFFAFFQYNILAIGVFSIIDFIQENQQYVYYYYLLHSTANLLLYSFITVAIIQCKRQLYRASLL